MTRSDKNKTMIPPVIITMRLSNKFQRLVGSYWGTTLSSIICDDIMWFFPQCMGIIRMINMLSALTYHYHKNQREILLIPHSGLPNSNPTRTISAYKCTHLQSTVSTLQQTQRSIAQLKWTIEPFVSALTFQPL